MANCGAPIMLISLLLLSLSLQQAQGTYQYKSTVHLVACVLDPHVY